jgi:GcrA cell cycle regulator
MSWTPARTDTLKALWLEGQSASFIATRLGEVTRNGVIGKVQRLGLNRPPGLIIHRTSCPTRRRTRQAARSRRRTTSLKRPAPRPQPKPYHRPKENLGVMLLTLRDCDCHWPIGDPYEEGFHFCGGPALQPHSYCDAHQAEGTRPRPRRRSSTLSI